MRAMVYRAGQVPIEACRPHPGEHGWSLRAFVDVGGTPVAGHLTWHGGSLYRAVRDFRRGMRELAGKRPKAREVDDYYATPGWVTRALLRSVDIRGPVLDPCAGDGAILAELGEEPRRFSSAIELDQGRARALFRRFPTVDVRQGDALTIHDDIWTRHPWIVTNPPYRTAERFLARALDLGEQAFAQRGQAPRVALLLRLNWLASAKRAALLARRPPPDVYVLSRRPSFSRDGRTDGTEYAWCVWDTSPVAERPGHVHVLSPEVCR